MRKSLIHLFIACTAIVLAACTDDKGSYGYGPVNKITISGLQDEYRVLSHDVISPTVKPELAFSAQATDDLTYDWQLDYKSICDHPTLDVPIDATIGEHTVTLVVTDNASTLRYFKQFKVNVVTPYTYGLLVLSRDDDGTGDLSFQRFDLDGTPHDFLPHVFRMENPDWGTLGQNPVGMTLVEPSDDNQQPGLYILSGNQDKVMTVLDVNTMQMAKAFSASSISGLPQPFEPQQIEHVGNKILILANGRLMTYNWNGTEAFTIPEASGHHLDWISPAYFHSYAIPGYDSQTKQFVYSSVTPGHIFGYDEVHSFDEAKIYELSNGQTSIDPVSLDGLTLVAAARMNDNGIHYTIDMGFFKNPYDIDAPEGASTLRFIFKDSAGKVYFYTYDFEVGDIMDSQTYEQYLGTLQGYGVTKDREVSGLTIDQNTVCCALPWGNYWMIANGRTLQREYWRNGTTSQSFTLPDEVKGQVTVMQPNSDETVLYVGLYDASSTSEAKGGIATFSLDVNGGTFGKLLHYYPNVCGRPMQILEKTK